MKSGSWSSYVAAGALGDGDGPDMTPEEIQAIEIDRAAQAWIDEHVQRAAKRLDAAGLANCGDLHSSLAAAFRAGMDYERKRADARLEAELDAIQADPLPPEQIDAMVRGAVNARWCDGCGDDRPFDPEHPEKWTVVNADGCFWRYCGNCTRRRRRKTTEAAQALVDAAERRRIVKGGTADESIMGVIDDCLASEGD